MRQFCDIHLLFYSGIYLQMVIDMELPKIIKNIAEFVNTSKIFVYNTS